MSTLFTPLRIRSVEFRNRIFVSPMCQYSSTDGLPTDWHLVHLGSRAVGGAALVLSEAAAVSPEGRISPDDAGIWSDAQADAWNRITEFIRGQGAVAGVQLAHAGRKASTQAPWVGDRLVGSAEGGWQPVAPSAVPFNLADPAPRELAPAEIEAVIGAFVTAAQRSVVAGFGVIELHAAHGYLLHQFLSPLSNRRTDRYGGPLANRMRLTLEVAGAVRAVLPAGMPLFVRLSATDWAPGGWDLPQSIELARALKAAGVDLIDCSSGGLVPDVQIPVGPGYQVHFAADIRREADICTGAVGMITDPEQAETVLASGAADAVLLARALLRDPYWPLHAAGTLKVDAAWPKQYDRVRSGTQPLAQATSWAARSSSFSRVDHRPADGVLMK